VTTAPSPSEQSLRLRFDEFELDEADARLTKAGKPVPLAPKPFAVLCALARTPRTLVTKNALLDSVWGHRFVTESVLKSTISELRATLRDDPKHPRYIETVSRRGYRFIAAFDAPATLRTPEPAAPSRTPAQPPASSSLIGRSHALERLRAAWRLAASGRHQTAWIAGEAGVGKTMLIEHLMAEVGEMRCAHGQCVEQYGTGEPYLPVLEALTALCRRDGALVELIRAVAPTWLVQLPWLSTPAEREALRRELNGSGQARMLREMGELLDRYTENRPLLLVTEDLHWSDRATMQLIDYMARRRGAARLLWLASFRLTEIIAADHPLSAARHELRLHGLCEEIVLDTFSEQEVAEYLAKRLPALATDEKFVRALHALTDGLPLFVADVVKDLIDHGEGAVGGGPSALRRVRSMVLPETLTGIIERYIRQLTPGERALLDAASACGVQFRPATVARVLERDVASLDEVCAELARRQRWLSELAPGQEGSVAGAGYAFRHELYRKLLYERIGAPARAELHRKVAAALERERADGGKVSTAELAFHFDRGGEPMPALHHYAEAAESALLHFSPAETMSLTERALALLPTAEASDARAALEATLGTLRGTAAVQLLGTGSIEAKRAYERAAPLLDRAPQHPLRALCLHGLGLVLCLRGELDEAHALARRIEALATQTRDRAVLLCACLVHGMVEHLRGRPRTAREWLERGAAAAEGFDETAPAAVFTADPSVLVLGLLATELLHLGFADQGRSRIQQAHARARALRQPGPQVAVLWLDALFHVLMGDPGRVAEACARLREVIEKYALPQGRAAELWFRGWAEGQLGDPRAGHRLIREGYARAVGLGIRGWGSETLGYAAEALARAGDWTAARRELDEALQCAKATGEGKYRTQLLILEGRIADALGEPDRSRESMRQAVAEARAREAPWLELIALSALSEREGATADDLAELRRVVERLTEGLDTAPVARARALLEAVSAG
jgi:DNA-binding winged helix-turn-helix (wHTH) protein/tetratricopeptide (TPR) repeat protein